MKKITVIVPAYNESTNLPRLVEALDAVADTMPAYDWEYLIVEDGSTDDTRKVLAELREKNPRINYLTLTRNFGKESALLAGMDYATGDAVVMVDADLQHPPTVIPAMVAEWERGHDDVYGRRRVRGKESWLRRRLSLAFYSLLQGTTDIDILQNVCDFRLLDRRVVDTVRKLPETQRYTKGLYCWVGYDKKEVLFDQATRTEGKSSYRWRSLFNLAIEGITCYTTSPLRISTVVGFAVSLLAMAYMVFIVVRTIFYGEAVQGFPTLMCAILLLGGLQLMALGIIGEYIARIFNETKKRPSYIPDTYNGVKV